MNLRRDAAVFLCTTLMSHGAAGCLQSSVLRVRLPPAYLNQSTQYYGGATFPIDERWLNLSTADLEAFASAWIDELRGTSDGNETGMSVTWMGLTAPPDVQWRFILAAVGFAEADVELGHIAAGPIECLLGRHGHAFIEQMEHKSQSDRKFARTMTGVWKYLMTDDIWERVQAIQRPVAEPLKSTDHGE